MVSYGITPRRSRSIARASVAPVPCTLKKTGMDGSSASHASSTPPVITSVRANAPQKFTTRDFTRGLSSTSSSAGVALVYASPPISRKFAGRPPQWVITSIEVMVSPAPLASTPTSPSSSMYFNPSACPRASSPVSRSGLPLAASASRRLMPESSRVNLQSSATSRPSSSRARGLTSSSSASLSRYARYSATRVCAIGASSAPSPSPSSIARADSGSSPRLMSTAARRRRSGIDAATSSTSMPPSGVNITMGPFDSASFRTDA